MSEEQHPLFTKLQSMSPQELELRRRAIVAGLLPGDYEQLSTEALEELCFITSTLRKRSAGPPKATKAPKKEAKTLDSLLDL